MSGCSFCLTPIELSHCNAVNLHSLWTSKKNRRSLSHSHRSEVPEHFLNEILLHEVFTSIFKSQNTLINNNSECLNLHHLWIGQAEYIW